MTPGHSLRVWENRRPLGGPHLHCLLRTLGGARPSPRGACSAVQAASRSVADSSCSPQHRPHTPALELVQHVLSVWQNQCPVRCG